MSPYWLMVTFLLGGLLGSAGISSIPVVVLCAVSLAVLAAYDQRERWRDKFR